jgi:uncharacterized damage-inducible protein DinB
MLPSLQPTAAIFGLNTRLLHNCLAGVNDELANRRITPGTNSLAFLAAHLEDSRHYVCRQLGRELANPLAGVLKPGKNLDEVGPLPPVAAILEAWDAVSAHLLGVVEELKEEEILRPAGFRFPGTDGTMGGMLTFMAQHDSYHIGQMALLRAQLGLGGMSYT